jgi:hypothetical protein
MDVNQGIYPQRRSTARAWVALIGAAAAVLLLVTLIAVACRAEQEPAGLGPDPSPSSQVDADGSDVAGPVGDGSEGGQPGSGSEGGQPGSGSDGGQPGSGSDGGQPGNGSGDGSNGGGDDDAGGGAPALAGYQVVQEQYAVPAHGFLRRSVACPDGTAVLGGGVRKVGGPIEPSPIVVQESNPGTTGGGTTFVWLVAARNTAAAERTLQISAVCAEPPPGYELVRTDATVQSGELVRQSVSCPAGTVVLGGGAQVIGAGSSDFRTDLLETAPDAVSGTATSWTVALLNDGGQQRTIGFRAVCAQAPSGYQVTSVQHTVPGGGHYRQSAPCPDGTVVTGGGVGPEGEVALDLYPQIRESGPHPAGWLAEVLNWVVEQPVAIRAICAAAE